jgi:serine/threonine protein kinase
MSVSSHDALPKFHGMLLKFDAPAVDVTDLTEDLAEEITAELAPSSPVLAEPPAPRAAREPTAAGAASSAAAGIVLRDRYVLETPLGTGGMAVVFRAVDLRRDAGSPEGRHVAVKLLRAELRDRPQCIARLQREFRQTHAVAHPNVVRFHDLDCDRGTWFIVMELLSGETLAPRLRRVAPSGIPQAEALAIAAAVAAALAHAHARGVTHGDVKPDNICLPMSGPPRLLDFGVAPEMPAADATTGHGSRSIGAATRAYASPEVLAGMDPVAADDVFSLACVTYEMLSGVHPYRRQSRDVAARTAAAPSPITSLDAGRAAALSSALDLRRAARPTVAEFAAALRGERRAVAVTSMPAAPPPPVAAPILADVVPAEPPRSRALPWSVVAAALAIALSIGILIGRGEPEAPPAALPAVMPPIEAAAPAVPAADKMLPSASSESPDPVIESATVAAKLPARPAQVAQAGLVSFDSSMMVVSKRAVVAAIPLRHFTHVRRGVQVAWRVIDGTARAGRDYGGPATGVENFVEGNTFRILYVPILPDVRSTLDRSFAVELTGASPGTELGPTQRVEVMILGTT